MDQSAGPRSDGRAWRCRRRPAARSRRAARRARTRRTSRGRPRRSAPGCAGRRPAGGSCGAVRRGGGVGDGLHGRWSSSGARPDLVRRTGDRFPVSRGHRSKRGDSPRIFPVTHFHVTCVTPTCPARNPRSVAPSERPRTPRQRVIARAQPGPAGCRGPEGARMQQPRHRIRAYHAGPSHSPLGDGPGHRDASASTGRPHRQPRLAPGRSPPPRNRARAVPMISGAMGVQMSEGMPTPPGYARSTGTVRALNLMIDFPDAQGEGRRLDRLAEFFPQTSEWFRTSSYGRLNYRPETPVKDWLRMPLPFAEYGIERGSPYEPGYRKLVKDLVAAADPKVDFSDVRPGQHPGHPERRALRTRHRPVGDLLRQRRGPLRRRRPARQHVLRLQPPGRRLGSLRRDRIPGPAPRERPRLRPARPLHAGGRRRRGALGHHVRGLGGQQRLAGLAQVEAGLAGRRPGQLRRHARHQRTHPRPAVRGGRHEAGLRTGERGVRLRRGGTDRRGQRRGGVQARRPHLQGELRRGHRPGPGHRRGQHRGQRRLHAPAERPRASSPTRPFEPGETFTDRANGIRISVLEKDADGNYRVRITRP